MLKSVHSHASQLPGPAPRVLSHPEFPRAHHRSGCSLAAAGSHRYLSLLEEFKFGGPQRLMTLTSLFTIWQEILHSPLEGPKVPPNPEFLEFSELRSGPEKQSHFPMATQQIPNWSQDTGKSVLGLCGQSSGREAGKGCGGWGDDVSGGQMWMEIEWGQVLSAQSGCVCVSKL